MFGIIRSNCRKTLRLLGRMINDEGKKMTVGVKIINREHILFSVLMVLGGIGLFFGWKWFWFLTDEVA